MLVNVEIRSEPIDGPVAASLIRALIAELDQRYPEEENGGGLELHEVVPPHGVFLLVRVGGQPVACGAVRRLEGQVAELKRMYVEPRWRGQGLARRLLVKLEEMSRQLGFEKIRLETGIRQPEAIGLYETSGYRRIPAYGEYEGSELSVCFEKSLSPLAESEQK